MRPPTARRRVAHTVRFGSWQHKTSTRHGASYDAFDLVVSKSRAPWKSRSDKLFAFGASANNAPKAMRSSADGDALVRSGKRGRVEDLSIHASWTKSKPAACTDAMA
jgi:hypothetical protein